MEPTEFEKWLIKTRVDLSKSFHDSQDVKEIDVYI